MTRACETYGSGTTWYVWNPRSFAYGFRIKNTKLLMARSCNYPWYPWCWTSILKVRKVWEWRKQNKNTSNNTKSAIATLLEKPRARPREPRARPWRWRRFWQIQRQEHGFSDGFSGWVSPFVFDLCSGLGFGLVSDDWWMKKNINWLQRLLDWEIEEPF